ncbi:UvrD-helicase domain-containing protein [Curtobacterium sp. MCBD17_032]|uniref:UvrD-helicase domain-containing protein n=1 Tax=Curtobacterium sp. MCBD17_032 TaxID=2175659 RepID=UPI000DA873A1|nr:ATP-dependent helicase [Curtobacterium sp. MCBD17_032]PZE86159.1 ATP-dependent helicase [Curtobacterium sp. MCBD17_032]
MAHLMPMPMPMPMLDLDESRERILASDGHIVIQGGPGCGKTTIALLKASNSASLLPLESYVLFLSFSRAAVRQVQDRMKDLVIDDVAAHLEIRTFHSIFIEIVLAHARLINGKEPRIVWPDEEKREQSIWGKDWPSRIGLLRQDGTLFFSDLAATVATIFERFPGIAALYSARYPFVFVDEFQDTDEGQWRVILALSKASTVVCLADPDQRIFDYIPGVDESRLPLAIDALGAEVFDLGGDNHRSPNSQILHFANSVLKNLPCAYSDDVKEVLYYSGTPDASIHLQVQQLLNSGNETVAVLTRTNSGAVSASDAIASLRTVSNTLTLPPIEHQLYWDPALAAAAGLVVASILEWPLLERATGIDATLRLVGDYFRIKAAGGNLGAAKTVPKVERARDAIASGRRPRSGLGSRLWENYSFVTAYGGVATVDWQVALAQLIGAAELLEVQRQARLVKLLKATDALSWILAEVWDGERGYRRAAETLAETFADDVVSDSDPNQSAVSVMTMHKSKGKEFDATIIVEGRYSRPLVKIGDKDESADRRLLRVAITRAKRQVIFVRPAGTPSFVPDSL